MQKLILRWGLCCFLLCFATTAWAAGEGLSLTGGIPLWPNPDTVGVSAMGMGGAGIAIGGGTSSLYLNPAALKRHALTYVIEGTFSFHPSADSRIFNIGLADSKSNRLIAAGASYSYFINPREDDGKESTLQGHTVRLSFAMDWRDIFFVGLTLKFNYFTRPFETDLYGLTADFGAIWKPHRLFALSVVGYNLVYNPSNEIPIAAAIGLGIGGDTPFRLAIDGIMDFKSKGAIGMELRAGLQYTFANIFTVRAGYQLDQVRDRRPVVPWEAETGRELGHFLTAGLGFRYALFGLEVAYRQQLAPSALLNNRYIGISIQLWPYGGEVGSGRGPVRAGPTIKSGGYQ